MCSGKSSCCFSLPCDHGFVHHFRRHEYQYPVEDEDEDNSAGSEDDSDEEFDPWVSDEVSAFNPHEEMILY